MRAASNEPPLRALGHHRLQLLLESAATGIERFF
jgi:hypothetical protein